MEQRRGKTGKKKRSLRRNNICKCGSDLLTMDAHLCGERLHPALHTTVVRNQRGATVFCLKEGLEAKVVGKKE